MRESGILMHITSLPGPCGVGSLGQHAFSFVDFLHQAGQRYWQILPLTPTGYGNSPYQSSSAFAGNWYLIDLPLLVEEGLLQPEEVYSVCWSSRENRVDFGIQYDNRLRVLKKAFHRFHPDDDYLRFCRESSNWLPDFTLFMALKEKFKGKPWYTWDEELKFRDTNAVWKARQELRLEIRFFSFVQYLFHKQWTALLNYAHENDVRIIGDVPIYVPYDSVEVWSSPELFQLDSELQPEAVAGCPPDAFSEDGQLWGNPLYRWDEMEKDGYTWWVNRLSAAGKLYDVIRLDHFRGFEAYWSIPYGDRTARGGKWVKGPAMKFISALQKKLPELELIAEDLGILTQEVRDLRDESGYPGMKVLGFAFDSRDPSDYLPYNHVKNSVCYTGTHDNMTTRQWFDNATEDAVEYAREFMTLSEDEGLVWGVIRTAMASVSDLCVVPLQDYLDLGEEGRMNFPGTTGDANWTWRACEKALTEKLAKRIRKLTTLYGRVPSVCE